jgi:hypothetical protein
MQLYRKEGNTIQILSFPTEEIQKGEYVLIQDSRHDRSLVTQIIDVQFAAIPGILEELLRDSTTDEHICGENLDPLEVAPHITYVQDARMLVCKIRGTIQNGMLSTNTGWLPSRSSSSITKLPTASLLAQARIRNDLPIDLGETRETSAVTIDAQMLDGKLNIVTGKKETGKSHISKLLALGLIDYGAPVVVLDLNGEYTHLGFSSDGQKNEYHRKVRVLTPGDNFKITLTQMKLRVMMNILFHALNLPGASAQEFRRIWRFLKDHDTLTMRELGEVIRNRRCNLHVRDALCSRYYSLLNSGFFTDNHVEATSLKKAFCSIHGGGALIINLKDISSINRQIVVEFMLGELVDLLTQLELKAVFLFAEEAHLYLRETYWNDIVTRMRHFGVFTTFVTNQPNTIRENIYRQADNIFLFNFTNEHDLEAVSRASKVDAETVKAIARELQPRHCLVLGKVVGGFPIVVKVRALDVQTMGQTRLFFTDEN